MRAIREVGREVIPVSAKLILFGSQARGDAHEDSDWDLLILLDKENIIPADYDDFAYPFFELGWRIDAKIHPLLYTFKDWERRSVFPLYKNVEKEGVELC